MKESRVSGVGYDPLSLPKPSSDARLLHLVFIRRREVQENERPWARSLLYNS